MYRQAIYQKTDIESVEVYEGEHIETKVERMLANKEPINESTPIIHTERKDGVQPAYNIRTDRHEMAVEGMDYVNKSNMAKRDNKAKMEIVKDTSKEGQTGDNGGTESSQGKTSTT